MTCPNRSFHSYYLIITKHQHWHFNSDDLDEHSSSAILTNLLYAHALSRIRSLDDQAFHTKLFVSFSPLPVCADPIFNRHTNSTRKQQSPSKTKCRPHKFSFLLLFALLPTSALSTFSARGTTTSPSFHSRWSRIAPQSPGPGRATSASRAPMLSSLGHATGTTTSLTDTMSPMTLRKNMSQRRLPAGSSILSTFRAGRRNRPRPGDPQSIPPAIPAVDTVGRFRRAEPSARARFSTRNQASHTHLDNCAKQTTKLRPSTIWKNVLLATVSAATPAPPRRPNSPTTGPPAVPPFHVLLRPACPASATVAAAASVTA